MMCLAVAGEDHGVAMRDVLASFVPPLEVPPAKADLPETGNIDRSPPTPGTDLVVWSHVDVFKSACKPRDGLRPLAPVLWSLVIPGATGVLKSVGQRGLEQDRFRLEVNRFLLIPVLCAEFGIRSVVDVGDIGAGLEANLFRRNAEYRRASVSRDAGQVPKEVNFGVGSVAKGDHRDGYAVVFARFEQIRLLTGHDDRRIAVLAGRSATLAEDSVQVQLADLIALVQGQNRLRHFTRGKANAPVPEGDRGCSGAVVAVEKTNNGVAGNRRSRSVPEKFGGRFRRAAPMALGLGHSRNQHFDQCVEHVDGTFAQQHACVRGAGDGGPVATVVV